MILEWIGLGLLWPETRPDRNRVSLSETRLDPKDWVWNRVGFLGLGLNLWAGKFVRWTLSLIRWAYSLLLLTLKSYLQPLVLVKWLPTAGPTQFLGPTIATGKLNSSLTFQCTCPLAFSFSLSNDYYFDPLNSSLLHKRILSVHTLSHPLTLFILFFYFWKAHPLTLIDSTNNPKNTASVFCLFKECLYIKISEHENINGLFGTYV